MKYLLTKSKYIRGLQCEKAMFLDVYHPELAHYSYETLTKFKRGRSFEKTFKDTFPQGIDISARLGNKIGQYADLTAKLLASPGEVALFEAGFQYNDVLVLADVVHKTEDGVLTIYEVKNGKTVSETFKNDVAIQYYVISHALNEIIPNDLFCTQLSLAHFYVLHNDGMDGFAKEDLMARSQEQIPTIEENVERFKDLLLQEKEPCTPMSPHCNTPYECPYQRYCRALTPETEN